MPGLGIKIEGVRQLTAAISRVEPELGKELGQRNKALGARIIAAAQPYPLRVGSGAGALPRPSANKNILRLLAGGSWRTHVPGQLWGSRWAPRENERPYLWQAGVNKMPEIEAEYLRALLEVARRAGIATR